MNFVEEDPLIKSRKNMHANPSIIKCFFEEEAVISAKKRHSLLDNNLKNQLDKVIQNRNCVSNKNEDDFILKQKELARKRSNISDFDIILDAIDLYGQAPLGRLEQQHKQNLKFFTYYLII